MLSVPERYQFKPFIGSSHFWAISKLTGIDVNKRVLDVGPGSCAIGAWLKEKGVNSLTAVDIDPVARERAKPIYSRVEESIEPLKGERFDLILLLDVVEHLPRPAEFLKAVSELLAPGGEILISVPNFIHWSVRIPMLFGFLPEAERGILDKTHLQTFTRKKLRKLISTVAGLEITEESVTIEPAELALPKILWDNNIFRKISEFRLWLAGAIPGLMAYQLLTRIRKNSA